MRTSVPVIILLLSFFFNDTATTEIYTLSLHDALPISPPPRSASVVVMSSLSLRSNAHPIIRSEEHTSELQSHLNLVCRLLLENDERNPTDRQRPHPTTHHHRQHEPDPHC